MKIAISSPKFSLIPFNEILPKISEKFNAWEIVAERLHYLPEIKNELRDFLQSYEIAISIHAPLSDINIGSINSNIREQSVNEISKTIDAARYLGADLVTFHPGHLSPLGIEIPKVVKQLTIESVNKLSDVADDFGINLAIENMPNMIWTTFDSPGELLDVIINTNVKMCFDIGHANTSNNIVEFLKYSKMYINVHLHDNIGKPDPHLTIGDGNTDFKNTLKTLLINYNGNLVIESKGLKSGIESKERLEFLLKNLKI